MFEPTDLAVDVTTISDRCVDGGFFADLEASLDDAGFVDDVIGDTGVRRDPTNIVVIDGDDLIHVWSRDAAALTRMAPFVTAFVAKTPPRDVTDDTTLAVGTCLYRAPSDTGIDEDRRTYATDCAAPHQGQVFHRFELPAGDYPGHAVVLAQAERGCVDAFGPFVGLSYEQSRLQSLHSFPLGEHWAAGDRGVRCIVYGSDPEELFHTSLQDLGV